VYEPSLLSTALPSALPPVTVSSGARPTMPLPRASFTRAVIVVLLTFLGSSSGSASRD